jgi:hypothetical protein
MQYKEYIKLLTEILDCGIEDVDYFLEKFNILNELEEDANVVVTSLSDIISFARENDILHINNLIYCVFQLTNTLIYKKVYNVLRYWRDKGKPQQNKGEIYLSKKLHDGIHKAYQRINEFDPFINYLNSEYCNELDEIDMKNKSFNEIVDFIIREFLDKYYDDIKTRCLGSLENVSK